MSTSALATLSPELLSAVTRSLDAAPDPEDIRPGWIALFSMLALLAVTVLLWLSMRKQLKKVDFEEPEDAEREPAEVSAGGSGVGRGHGPADGAGGDLPGEPGSGALGDGQPRQS